MDKVGHTTNHFLEVLQYLTADSLARYLTLMGDGKLDGFEQAVSFAAFMSIMESESSDCEGEIDSNDCCDECPSPLFKKHAQLLQCVRS